MNDIIAVTDSIDKITFLMRQRPGNDDNKTELEEFLKKINLLPKHSIKYQRSPKDTVHLVTGKLYNNTSRKEEDYNIESVLYANLRNNSPIIAHAEYYDTGMRFDMCLIHYNEHRPYSINTITSTYIYQDELDHNGIAVIDENTKFINAVLFARQGFDNEYQLRSAAILAFSEIKETPEMIPPLQIQIERTTPFFQQMLIEPYMYIWEKQGIKIDNSRILAQAKEVMKNLQS
ncbi:MAG: hypothetical protein ACMXYG_06900 [Candidatus Woesearchaeota archaeon]